jgi:hypothetical protein
MVKTVIEPFSKDHIILFEFLIHITKLQNQQITESMSGVSHLLTQI